MRRFKVGVPIFLVAGALWYAARKFPAADADWQKYVQGTMYGISGMLSLMAVGLILFGKLKLTSLFVVDLRAQPPIVHIGPPGARFHISNEWKKGGIRMPGAGVFVVVPFAVRLAFKSFLGYLTYHFLQLNEVLAPMQAAGAGAVTFVLAWLAEKKLGMHTKPDDEQS